MQDCCLNAEAKLHRSRDYRYLVNIPVMKVLEYYMKYMLVINFLALMKFLRVGDNGWPTAKFKSAIMGSTKRRPERCASYSLPCHRPGM